MSKTTHHNGQVRATCPECEHTIRLRAVASDHFGDRTHVWCGNCDTGFHASRETGEVLE